MSDALLSLLPIAIVVGLSPIPVIQMILVIFSQRRGPNMLAFVATLVAASAAVVAIGVATYEAAEESYDDAGKVAAFLLIAVGGFLLATGMKYWRNRGDSSEPKVFAKIAAMGPGAAALLAASAVFVNPKNLVLLLAAGQTIGAADAGDELALAAAFVALAATPYLAVTAYALLGGDSADANLDRLRAWLIERNRAIMGVVSIAIGGYLVAKGYDGL